MLAGAFLGLYNMLKLTLKSKGISLPSGRSGGANATSDDTGDSFATELNSVGVRKRKGRWEARALGLFNLAWRIRVMS